MELSASFLSAVTKPTFLLLAPEYRFSFSDFAEEPGTDSASNDSREDTDNPCSASSQWRIDGSNMLGRQLYAVPNHIIDLPPMRLDVYLPDQGQMPRQLRKALESSRSVVLRNGQDIGKLRISQLVCSALDFHCQKNPQFWDEYRNLPFGSCLVFSTIDADPRKMDLTIQPAYDLERQTKSLRQLQEIWIDSIPRETWPPAIDIGALCLLQQLHDSVSLVHITGRGDQEFIFKSSVSDMALMYHELRFLLVCPPTSNMIGKPLYIVTKKSAFGGKQGVYGFILPYHRCGSLRDVLPAARNRGDLTLERQLKWAKQITATLIHIRHDCNSFYSDLRPDNTLLDSNDDLVVIDFEQRGNWYEWSAPEVRYRMYVEHLSALKAATVGVSSDTSLSCARRLLNAFYESGCRSKSLREGKEYEPVPTLTSRNVPWLALDSASQERAMVYSLGLMLFCIFEGTCNPIISLTNEWPNDPHVAFPNFICAPKLVRGLVRQCTADAPEWSLESEGAAQGTKRFARSKDKVFVVGSESASQSEILTEIARAWQEEVETATTFFNSKKWLAGEVGSERPTLKQVLEVLQNIERTLLNDPAKSSKFAR